MYLYIYVYIYISTNSHFLTLKTYNKIRRAADIISHSSSERRSIGDRSSPMLLVASQHAHVRTPRS